MKKMSIEQVEAMCCVVMKQTIQIHLWRQLATIAPRILFEEQANLAGETLASTNCSDAALVDS